MGLWRTRGKTPFFIRCKVIGGSHDLLDKFISKASNSLLTKQFLKFFEYFWDQQSRTWSESINESMTLSIERREKDSRKKLKNEKLLINNIFIFINI